MRTGSTARHIVTSPRSSIERFPRGARLTGNLDVESALAHQHPPSLRSARLAMGDELEVSFQEDAIVVGGVAYGLPDPPVTNVGQLLAFIEQQVSYCLL